ncbi:polymyxin resistance protein ArnC glycosyl transferase [Vibrio astriarenae]|nr:polymyxin resistance protein ArnC glycosyl transferase [Vibrio sp. C7]
MAMDGITSFSIRPLRMATIAGSMTALSAFIYGLWIVLKTMVFGEPVTGYPSMMVVVLGLGGVQLLSIGLLGEYIGRIFVETKKRPLYIVKSLVEKKVTSLPQNETSNLSETA